MMFSLADSLTRASRTGGIFAGHLFEQTGRMRRSSSRRVSSEMSSPLTRNGMVRDFRISPRRPARLRTVCAVAQKARRRRRAADQEVCHIGGGAIGRRSRLWGCSVGAVAFRRTRFIGTHVLRTRGAGEAFPIVDDENLRTMRALAAEGACESEQQKKRSFPIVKKAGAEHLACGVEDGPIAEAENRRALVPLRAAASKVWPLLRTT